MANLSLTSWPSDAVFALLTGGPGVGLWRLTEWARASPTAAVLILALLLPVGLINPMAAPETTAPQPALDLVVRI